MTFFFRLDLQSQEHFTYTAKIVVENHLAELYRINLELDSYKNR